MKLRGGGGKGPGGAGGRSPMALKRYPNAAVMAPFANFPPPATAARPPSTELATRPWMLKLRPLISGPAKDVTAPARAEGPHLPEATVPLQRCPTLVGDDSNGAQMVLMKITCQRRAAHVLHVHADEAAGRGQDYAALAAR
jgi:hypothetical protein